MVNQHHHQDKSFHLFVYLNEDIKATVLSFLADAPFECTQEVGSASSLTHKLPHVSQKFRRLASLDLLWKDAMLRQMKKEPFLWKPALHKMMQIAADGQDSKGEKEKESSPQELVEEAYKCNNCSSYKVLYQNVVTKHLRFKGPVFHMEGQGTFLELFIAMRMAFVLQPSCTNPTWKSQFSLFVAKLLRHTTVCLGEPYSLHFFEPRYRYLIAEIMRDFPEEAKHGGRIDNPPCFLHANRGPLAPTTPVTLVQVIRCEMFPDGRADVLLMPTAVSFVQRRLSRCNHCEIRDFPDIPISCSSCLVCLD